MCSFAHVCCVYSICLPFTVQHSRRRSSKPQPPVPRGSSMTNYLMDQWSTASAKDASQVVNIWRPKLRDAEGRILKKLRCLDFTLEQPPRRISDLDKDSQDVVGRHTVFDICWSPRLTRSHYCQQLTLSVRLSVPMSVCHAPSNCFFLFFGRQFSIWHSTKRCSSIFDLGFLTPKIYSPKFAQNRL